MDKSRSWKKREGYIFGGFGLLAGFVACNKSKNNFIRHGGPVVGGLLGYQTGGNFDLFKSSFPASVSWLDSVGLSTSFGSHIICPRWKDQLPFSLESSWSSSAGHLLECALSSTVFSCSFLDSCRLQFRLSEESQFWETFWIYQELGKSFFSWW